MLTSDPARAADWLRQRKLCAIPTETVYGLAALASDEAAVRRVFELKARPFFDPLIVHVGEWEQLHGIIQGFSAAEEHLARKFWPGPLTIVTPKRPEVSPLITSGHETVAVRMPRHALTLELLRILSAPVVAPSANKFGRTSPTSALHVEAELVADDLLVLDGGTCDIGIESTVIQIDGPVLRLLRPGGVSREELEAALEEGDFPITVERVQSSQSPGHLKHHYQPKTPLYVAQEIPEQGVLEELLGLKIERTSEIALDSDPTIAARELYALLRTADESSPDLITLRWNVPTTGLWEAIWDRVQRAATFLEV